MDQTAQDNTPGISPEMLEEIRDIHHYLLHLRGRFAHIPDAVREIDDGLHRIERIEQHVGIDRKQVA